MQNKKKLINIETTNDAAIFIEIDDSTLRNIKLFTPDTL